MKNQPSFSASIKFLGFSIAFYRRLLTLLLPSPGSSERNMCQWMPRLGFSRAAKEMGLSHALWGDPRELSSRMSMGSRSSYAAVSCSRGCCGFLQECKGKGRFIRCIFIMQPSEWHPWSVTTRKEIFLQPPMLTGNPQAWRSSNRIFACVYLFSKSLSSLQGCTIKYFHLLEASVGLSSCTKSLVLPAEMGPDQAWRITYMELCSIAPSRHVLPCLPWKSMLCETIE